MLLLLSAVTFSKNYFRNTIRVSKGLDPEQDRHFVGSNLGPNCLQRLSAQTTKVASGMVRVKEKLNNEILPFFN